MTTTLPLSSDIPGHRAKLAAGVLIPPREPGRSPSMSLAAVRELLEFPCQWLADLPEPFSVRLIVAGAPVPIVFELAVRAAEVPVLATRIVFDREEVRALAIGVQADRIWHREFLGFCFEKWRKPAFRVGLSEALDGAMPDLAQPPWALARILARLQASIEAPERQRAQPLHPLSVAA